MLLQRLVPVTSNFKGKNVAFLIVIFLSFIWSEYTIAQVTVDQGVGTNLRRQDPVQYLDCVGFIREYHDWVIDEGGVFATPIDRENQEEDCFDGIDNNGDDYPDCEDSKCQCASEAYPFNRYQWNPWISRTIL